MKTFYKLLAAAIATLGFAQSASAAQMCPGSVYYAGECISVLQYINSDFGPIMVGASGSDDSTGTPPKSAGPRLDVAADLAAVAALQRDRSFIRARDTLDLKTMVAIMDRTPLVLSPGHPAMRQMCKPPVGVLVWGYTVISIKGVLQGTYGWVCQPMSRSVNPK